MINCLIWKTTMEYNDINLNKAICKNPTPPFKMELDLFTLKEMCVKMQRIMSCKTKS